MTIPLHRLLTRQQIMARYGLSRRQLARLIHKGRLVVVAHYPGRKQRFDPRDVALALGPAPTFAARSAATPSPVPLSSPAPPSSGSELATPSAEGELVANAFRLFEQGKSVREVVIELRRPVREVQALERAFHGCGDDASLATFFRFARAELATVALPFPTTIEAACHLLRDLVATKARVELAAALRASRAHVPSAPPPPPHHDDEPGPPSEGPASA